MWKKAGEGLSDRLVEGIVKFGGGSLMMWGCMTWQGVGYATKIDGRMDRDFYLQILKDELFNSLQFMVLMLLTSSFSRTMTPNILARR